jgi:pectin methylesterase-like acyl-CoA thioesterase
MIRMLAAASVALAVVASPAGPAQPPAAPPARSPERADLIVAQDGTGRYRTIQAALDALPKNNVANKIVLVRHGIYREKIYVTTSHVSLVGEDRAACMATPITSSRSGAGPTRTASPSWMPT